MTRLDRDTVMASLRAEDVADHLGIASLSDQRWRGRWMRAARCARTDHATQAFGLARDGMWHCWSCDMGGDLLDLIAVGEGLNIKVDFGRVLEIAAGIAGVEPEPDLFAQPIQRPPRKARPDPPALLPIAARIEAAQKRCMWTWPRLYRDDVVDPLVEGYLRSRGLDPAVVMAREVIGSTPMRIPADLRAAIEQRPSTVSQDMRTLWWTFGVRRGTMSIVVPVRSVDTGLAVDLRARRVEPESGQPKIIGMVGGVTVDAADRGKTRRLIGCYGNPHCIESDHVVVCEGLMDYLTGLALWPNAQVLGATDAGSLGLVAAHAAKTLASRSDEGRLTIVEQCDPPRTLNDGRTVPGAADQSINEDPNAATKVAVRYLGPNRVGWLFCQHPTLLVDGKPVKDLNDLVRAGADVAAMMTWWTDLAAEST